jgi:hypothetical protein
VATTTAMSTEVRGNLQTVFKLPIGGRVAADMRLHDGNKMFQRSDTQYGLLGNAPFMSRGRHHGYGYFAARERPL